MVRSHFAKILNINLTGLNAQCERCYTSEKIEFSVIDKHIICIDCLFQVNVVRRSIMLITTLLE